MGEPLGDVANRLLFENEVVRVWEMDLAPGERSDRHRHDLPYLLCVLEGTRIDADIEGRGVIEIPVRSGSVFFVPPGETETAINATGARFRDTRRQSRDRLGIRAADYCRVINGSTFVATKR